MNILIVNDDGYEAFGFKLLAHSLAGQGRVFACAPKVEQSATSQKITIAKKLKYEEVTSIPGTQRTIAVDGTPADCVRLGLKIYSDVEFDLIVSGINSGPNLSRDTLYSGTVAAATEGYLLGIPSIAISAADIKADFIIDETIKICEVIISKNIYKKYPLLNINFPSDKPLGRKITVLGSRTFHAEYKKINNENAFAVSYSINSNNEIKNSDDVAQKAGYTTITPLLYDKTDHKLVKSLEKNFEE
ncbi:MAG: 5'/3'-nucleotidase SurE [Acholeplasmatales bacterium]|jgi:5'-nucleotidase|nr:5'/3'-nucleotidase SurE [Acholeplasmatales bacterium]